MGETYTEIVLKNAGDVFMAKRRLIKQADVRKLTVQATADTIDQQLVGKHGDKAVFKAVSARRR